MYPNCNYIDLNSNEICFFPTGLTMRSALVTIDNLTFKIATGSSYYYEKVDCLDIYRHVPTKSFTNILISSVDDLLLEYINNFPIDNISLDRLEEIDKELIKQHLPKFSNFLFKKEK